MFSFHHVPLITEVLKASFATPIKWPGIRLQKIAQPLLNYAFSINKEIEIAPVELNEVKIEEVVDSSSANDLNFDEISNSENNIMEDNCIVSVGTQQTNVLTEIEKRRLNNVYFLLLIHIVLLIQKDGMIWSN